jgi:UDP-N-acetylglucosamine--N-acetylmuramyl-(pentapeptide) pyrophosphoryl-undecaprenol N-acetylglucosamine transferase
MGGSQGSEAINKLMLGSAALLAHELPDLEVIHLAGPSYTSELREAYARAGLKAEVHDYLEDMRSAYRRSKLAICRAGGTTIAELMALGIPALLIPYPYSADDHQTLNARAVVSRGAGICLAEKDASPEALTSVVSDLFGNPAKLELLRQNTRSLAMPDASERILQRLSVLSGSVGE